jgi:hypothetical protein
VSKKLCFTTILKNKQLIKNDMPVATQIQPPPTQNPPITEQLGTGLTMFLKNYWGYVLLFAVLLVAGYMAYIIWKWDKERKETVFEKISRDTEQMCNSQASPKRKESNKIIMFGLIGLITAITGIMSIIMFGFMGLFASPMFMFTIILFGGIIEKQLHPFMKSDAVYLRYRDETGILREKWIGNYLGEYYSSDGYFNLLIYKGRRKLIFRNKMVVRVPQNTNAFFDSVEKLEEEPFNIDKVKKQVSVSSDFIRDILQFNDNTIIINYAKSLEKFQYFYYPVFVDDKGEIINNGLRYYESVKAKAILETLYEQTDEYAKAQIKAIRINPNVQYKQATGDEVIDTTDDEFDKKKKL